MEDERWARRQREWDAWRAEEEARRQREWDAWEATQEAERMRMRKEAHRRERDDSRREYWETTDPLTTDEEEELRHLKDFDQWEEFINNGNR